MTNADNKRKAAKVVVEQFHNPKFDYHDPACTLPKLVYCVLTTTNTIDVELGDNLTPAEVNALIDAGVTVDVRRPK